MKRTLEERKVRAEGMSKGSEIEVLQAISIEDAIRHGISMVFIPVIGEDQFCRSLDDVETVLDEQNMEGDFIPVRRASCMITRRKVLSVNRTSTGFTPVVTRAAQYTAPESAILERAHGTYPTKDEQ